MNAVKNTISVSPFAAGIANSFSGKKERIAAREPIAANQDKIIGVAGFNQFKLNLSPFLLLIIPLIAGFLLLLNPGKSSRSSKNLTTTTAGKMGEVIKVVK